MRTAAIGMIVIVLTLMSAYACGKKEAEAPAKAAASAEEEPKEAEQQEPEEATRLARNEMAEKLLARGTSSQNLNDVFAAGVMQLELAQSAEQASSIIHDVLFTYNVAELRKREEADLKAGQEIPARLQEQRTELEQQYKTLKAKFAKENSQEFAQSARAWESLWGIE